MLAVHIPSVGPETQEPRQSPEKGHMVFRVEVLCCGRRHTVPRRYSEFHALHKRVRRRGPPTDPSPAPAQPMGGRHTYELGPQPPPPPLLPQSLRADPGHSSKGQIPACP
nr:sorting nexin-22 [Manis javanica]